MHYGREGCLDLVIGSQIRKCISGDGTHGYAVDDHTGYLVIGCGSHRVRHAFPGRYTDVTGGGNAAIPLDTCRNLVRTRKDGRNGMVCGNIGEVVAGHCPDRGSVDDNFRDLVVDHGADLEALAVSESDVDGSVRRNVAAALCAAIYSVIGCRKRSGDCVISGNARETVARDRPNRRSVDRHLGYFVIRCRSDGVRLALPLGKGHRAGRRDGPVAALHT